MVNLEAILLGLILGGSATGVLALFLVSTRAARRVRNPFAICLGYVLIGTSAIGSVLAVLTISDRLGMSHNGRPHYAALYAYAISYASGVFISVWRESKWRKAVSLDDKTLMSIQRNKNRAA